MTKIKLLPVLSIFTVLLMATPVFAQKTNDYNICTVNGCNITGIHQHDGKDYAGHYYGDGHENHQICSVANCTETGTHEHNGVTYFGHHNGDGHTYHNGSESNHRSNHGNGNGRHH